MESPSFLRASLFGASLSLVAGALPANAVERDVACTRPDGVCVEVELQRGRTVADTCEILAYPTVRGDEREPRTLYVPIGPEGMKMSVDGPSGRKEDRTDFKIYCLREGTA